MKYLKLRIIGLVSLVTMSFILIPIEYVFARRIRYGDVQPEDFKRHDQVYTYALHTHPDESIPSELRSEIDEAWRKLQTVFHIGRLKGILANGLIGYHAYHGVPFEKRMGLARNNLVNIIVEGVLRPARGYTGGRVYIDNEGRLIDESAVQAFAAPLYLGNMFNSSGFFGPYWIIFESGVLDIDRASGIPIEYHKYYLVPEELDRRFLIQEIDSKVREGKLDFQTAEAAKGKIITLDEFIGLYEDFLQERGLEGLKVDSEEVVIEGSPLDEQREQLHDIARSKSTWQEAADFFISKIKDPSQPIQIRQELITDFGLITGWFGVKLDTVMPYLNDTLFEIIFDKSEAETLRVTALNGLGKFIDQYNINEFISLVMNDENLNIKISAIKILSYSENPKAGQFLSKLALDPNEHLLIRRNALFYNRHPLSKTLEAIEVFLESGDPQEKRIALYVLGRIPMLLPESLLRKVEAIFLTTPRVDLRRYAASILNRFCKIPHLDRPLQGRFAQIYENPLRSKSDFMRAYELYEELGQIRPSTDEFDEYISERREYIRILTLRLLEKIQNGEITLISEGRAELGDILLDLTSMGLSFGFIGGSLPDNLWFHSFGYGSGGFPIGRYFKKLAFPEG